jgi:hypothetical protein
MKAKVIIFRAAAAVALICAPMPAQSGIVDLLRGDPNAPSAPLRRVAFVGSAEVKEVSGEAELLTGIDQWSPLRKGAKLAPGDIIRTGQGAAVIKMTESGSLVRVTPRVMLRLAPLQKGWDPGILSGAEERDGFTVRSCRGQAEFKEGGGNWRAVAVNDVLPEGAVVRLAPGAVVDLYSTADRRAMRLQTADETILASRRSAQPSIAAVVP